MIDANTVDNILALMDAGETARRAVVIEHGFEHIKQDPDNVVEPKPGETEAMLRNDLKFMYECGTKLEYYSTRKSLWMPASVNVVVKQVKRSNLDVDTVVMYDISVLGTRVQEQQDVPLDALRLPFEAGELVDIYARRQGGIVWLPGIINGPQVSGATMVGYQVLLSERAEV